MFDGVLKEAEAKAPVDLESLPVEERRRIVCGWLRGPLPPGHKWDYGIRLMERSCGTAGCALGIIDLRVGDRDLLNRELGSPGHAGEFLGIGYKGGNACFHHAHKHYGVKLSQVTPAMVADLIEKCAAEQQD